MNGTEFHLCPLTIVEFKEIINYRPLLFTHAERTYPH